MGAPYSVAHYCKKPGEVGIMLYRRSIKPSRFPAGVARVSHPGSTVSRRDGEYIQVRYVYLGVFLAIPEMRVYKAGLKPDKALFHGYLMLDEAIRRGDGFELGRSLTGQDGSGGRLLVLAKSKRFEYVQPASKAPAGVDVNRSELLLGFQKFVRPTEGSEGVSR